MTLAPAQKSITYQGLRPLLPGTRFVSTACAGQSRTHHRRVGTLPTRSPGQACLGRSEPTSRCQRCIPASLHVGAMRHRPSCAGLPAAAFLCIAHSPHRVVEAASGSRPAITRP